MRIPNPRLLRLGGLTRGAIMGPGDGELQIPAVVQPSLVIPSPVNSFVSNQLRDDSVLFSDTISLAGINPATSLTLMSFVKGLWRFSMFFNFSFSGTNAFGNASGYVLVDNALNQGNIFIGTHITGSNVGRQMVFDILFERDGFAVTRNVSAMVAGDLLRFDLMCHAGRLL